MATPIPVRVGEWERRGAARIRDRDSATRRLLRHLASPLPSEVTPRRVSGLSVTPELAKVERATQLLGVSRRPNGRPMSPSHTRRRGRIYRYYVSREAIADGYDTCAVTSVPAADVDGSVLDHVQKLLAAPEIVARTWSAAKRESQDEITEREVTVLLAEFSAVWSDLFPAEQARIVQLLVEQVDVRERALEVRIRAEGLVSLVGELREKGERMAA